MKRTIRVMISAAVAALALLAAGCQQPVASPAEITRGPAAGKGMVNVEIEGAAERSARTLLPNTGGLTYFLTFTAEGKDEVGPIDISNSVPLPSGFELEPGNWTVTVEGKIVPPGTSIVIGTAPVVIEAGKTIAVKVVLRPVDQEAGVGTLTYSISFPGDVNAATLRLFPIPDNEDNPPKTIDLLPNATVSGGVKTGAGTVTGLFAGYYRAVVYLTRPDGTVAGQTEVAHIYDTLTTPMAYTFAAGDFAAANHVFTSIADLDAYLKSVRKNTADAPYRVSLSVPIADLGIGADPLQSLFGAFNNKYVALDLSACTWTVTGDATTGNTGISARQNKDKLVSVILPNGLQTLGQYNFKESTSLTTVLFPAGLETIGTYAFEQCKALVSVVLPDTVSSIGNYAFNNCSALASVKLPDRPAGSTIGTYAFQFCTSLTGIDLPDTITSIGTFAFANTSLTSVRYPRDLTKLDSSFRDISTLTSVDFTRMTTPTASANKKIPSSEFANCSSLPSIVIPDWATELGSMAFSGCSQLASVSLPDGLTTIGTTYPFAGCNALASIVIRGTGTTAGGHSVMNNNILIQTTGPTVKLIAWPAAEGNVTIPDVFTEIIANSFRGNDRMTSVKVTASSLLTNLPSAFYNCTALKTIDFSLSNTLLKVEMGAFTGCRSLVRIDLPISLNNLATSAIGAGLISLRVVILRGVIPSTFGSTSLPTSIQSPDVLFYVPDAELTNYHTNTTWESNFGSRTFGISTAPPPEV